MLVLNLLSSKLHAVQVIGSWHGPPSSVSVATFLLEQGEVLYLLPAAVSYTDNS